MAKKKIWLVILAIVLVFGMAVVGCDDGSDDGTKSDGGGVTDTWTNITSLIQLNGTWKGPYTDTQPYGEGITMKDVREITITITAANANTGTWTRSEKCTITFSGGNINTAWPTIKEDYRSREDGVYTTGMTFNDSTHTVSFTSPPLAPSPTTLSEYSNQQINQNGTKWKWPTTGIILTKQ